MTTRKQAIKWWNNFEASTKQILCDEYEMKRQFDTLTGREIEVIWQKENKRGFGVENSPNQCLKPKESIYLNRLKQEYRKYAVLNEDLVDLKKRYLNTYSDMRLFCLDTQLLSFNEIEVMENEVNKSFCAKN